MSDHSGLICKNLTRCEWPSRLISPNVRWLRGTRPVTGLILVLEEPQLHNDFAALRERRYSRGDHLQRICFGNHSKLDRIRRRK